MKHFKHGVFLQVCGGLENFITEEIVWKHCDNLNLKCSYPKVIRDMETGKARGSIFVPFDDFHQAIDAKQKLNYSQVIKNSPEIIASLIIPMGNDQKKNNNNLIIQNLPEGITDKEFDQEISKYGVLISSKLSKNKNLIGHANFLQQEDATKFLESCQKDQIKIRDSVIKAVQFKSHKITQEERRNLYFKDFTTKYTKHQLSNKQFVENEKAEIKKNLQKECEKFGKIVSVAIMEDTQTFSNFNAFVCFETHDEAQKCLNDLSNNKDFMFQYITWAKNKKEREQEVNENIDRRFIYMKNIKPTVTYDQLIKILNDILSNKIVTLKLKKCPIEYVQTQYATLVTEEENKLNHIINAAQDGQYKNQEFQNIFQGRYYIKQCFPRQRHRVYVEKNQSNKFRPSNQQYQQKRNNTLQPLPNPMLYPQNIMFQQQYMFPPIGQMGMPQMNTMFPPMQQVQSAPPGMGFQQTGSQVPLNQQNFPGLPSSQGQIFPPTFNPQYQQPRQQLQPRTQQQFPLYQQNMMQQQPFGQMMPPQNRPYQKNYQNNQQQRPQQQRFYGQQQRYGQQQGQGIQQQYQQRQQQGNYQNNKRQYQNNNRRPYNQNKYNNSNNQQNDKKVKQVSEPVKKYVPKQTSQQQPQQQLQQQTQVTIKSIKEKFDDFKKLGQSQQIKVLLAILSPIVTIQAKNKQQVKQICNILLDASNFTIDEMIEMLEDDEELKERIAEAEELLAGQ